MEIKVSDLNVHPLNTAIYGDAISDANFDELVDSIKKHGVLVPLMVNKSNLIISGHRRYAACQRLGMERVPAHVSDIEDDLDIQEALIEANRQREKTNDQKAREYHKLEAIEKERAKRRQVRTEENRNLVVENFPRQATGKSRDHAASKVGFSNARTAEQARDVAAVVDEYEKMGDVEKAGELKSKLNKSVYGAYKEAEDIIKQRKEEKSETKTAKYTVEKLDGGLFVCQSTNPKYKPVMNATNDNIEWAKWSWNPVTGCRHDCPYCYARAKAENDYYADTYVTKFAPTFHPGRLAAPDNTKIPESRRGEPGINNVFVCSMADLFGAWVPSEWIQEVLAVVSRHASMNFLFLTKNPRRYLKFNFPPNAWIGATADNKARHHAAVSAFNALSAAKKAGKTNYGIGFLSCEPLTGHLGMTVEQMPFDWLIIGGFKSGKQPEWEWVENIYSAGRAAGCKIYFKPNLTARPMEYPVVPRNER